MTAAAVDILVACSSRCRIRSNDDGQVKTPVYRRSTYRTIESSSTIHCSLRNKLLEAIKDSQRKSGIALGASCGAAQPVVYFSSTTKPVHQPARRLLVRSPTSTTSAEVASGPPQHSITYLLCTCPILIHLATH
jgi:hypothetical protein